MPYTSWYKYHIVAAIASIVSYMRTLVRTTHFSPLIFFILFFFFFTIQQSSLPVLLLLVVKCYDSLPVLLLVVVKCYDSLFLWLTRRRYDALEIRVPFFSSFPLSS